MLLILGSQRDEWRIHQGAFDHQTPPGRPAEVSVADYLRDGVDWK